MTNNKNNDVESWIVEQIAKGALNSGSSINEMALSEQFHLSRHKIRESLNQLAFEGILEKKVNKGFFVLHYSIEEAKDSYRMRANLAHLAGQLLSERISLDDLQKLRELHKKMVTSVENRELEEYFQLNNQLHELLFKATKCAPLIQFNHILSKRFSAFLHKEMSDPIGLQLSNKEHLDLINYIAEGKSESAAICFEKHILKGINSL